MRKYGNEAEKILTEVVCNRCGKKLKVEGGILKEGCFHGQAKFGYFSRKDGTTQQFDLCEDCYDAVTAGFLFPVEETEETEMV
jgi:hypothetical protein